MDHLAAAAPGVHCYANYSSFGEVLGTGTLHPVEWLDVSRQFAPTGHVHYGTAEVGTVHYVQDVVADTPLAPHLKLEATTKPEVQQTSKPVVGEKIACQECGATFACGANLRNHMRIHTGERPYICEECGASFTQRSNLRSHKRVHTGERPYMCGICGQTFARSSHLPGHMRTHTGEKPFDCRQCGRSFATNQIMKNHMRTHTGERPFSCDFCDATFAQSSCLATHRKIHTGERNFKCGECGKAFISRSGLQTHERVHTGEKPYTCVTCDKSFKTSSYLSKHKQKYCGNNGYKNRVRQPEAKRSGRKPGSSKKMIKSKRSSQTSRSVNKIRTKRLRRSRRVKNSDSEEESLGLLEEATLTEINGSTDVSSVKKERNLDMLSTNSVLVKKENDVQDSRGYVDSPLDASIAKPESDQAKILSKNTQSSKKENADAADSQDSVEKIFTNKCTNSYDIHEFHPQIPANYKDAIPAKGGTDIDHTKAISEQPFHDAPTYVMLDQMTLTNQSLEGIPDQLLMYHDVFHS